MNRLFVLSLVPCLLAATLTGGVFPGLAAAAERSVELVNHQPFDIRMPVALRGVKLEQGEAVTDDRRPVQQHGDDVVFIADLPASQTKSIKFVAGEIQTPDNELELKPAEHGAAITFGGKDLGTLAWDVNVRKADPDVKDGAPSTKRDFDALFKPLPVKLERTTQGPLFDVWTAKAEKDGVELALELHAYPAGYLDVTAHFTNRSAPTTDVYAAVLTRWEQPGIKSRTASYNYETASLNEGVYTPFREGTERHLFIQRGLDWINNGFDNNVSVGWLNDFAPSFTTYHKATAKTPARWLGANTAQLGQEAQAAAGGRLYSITEIARPNVRMYRTRLSDNVLPQPGEPPLTFTSRLIFSDSSLTDEQVDNQFVGYVGWRHQSEAKPSTPPADAGTGEVASGSALRLDFGVPFTRFGTNYFPYSTLGENFIDLRTPGMSKEGYWPLAAATVNEFEKFADIIRRDLRTLTALGYEVSRLHHLEVLWDKDPATGKEYVSPERRDAYLDFYFDELKTLGLTALLDVKLPAETVGALVERYREQVEGVEIDNEILLFMLPEPDVSYWKDVYAAVKKVAPEVPVHLTIHTNTGAFDRAAALGVPFDKIGAHAYMDSPAAITSSRGYALAVANYAAERNKEVAITEWNWRFLTRMTEDARAQIYAPIFENVLRTRSVSTMYQFQYNDGLAMNPAQLKGIRHYEQVHLSRRPKPEALVMAKLIRTYGDPAGPTARIDVGLDEDRPVVAFKDGTAKGRFTLTNTSADKKPIALKASIECFDGAEATLDDATDASITLEPGQSKAVAFTVTAPKDALPGFYHVFLRLEGDNGVLRYAWAEARLEGQPQLDKKQTRRADEVAYVNGAMDFDFNRPIAIVYGNDAPIPELEAAWVVYQTLESATGRKVEIFHMPELPADVRSNGTLIVVGTRESNELVAQAPLENVAADAFVVRTPGGDGRGEWLVVGGKDTAGLQKAAMDLTLRYWKFAKDSAIRRVGTTSAPSGQGGVKTDID